MTTPSRATASPAEAPFRSLPMSRAITGHTRLAAVVGDPVRHSLSPAIHNAAFAAVDLDWVYTALPVPEGEFAEVMGAIRSLGIAGLSVTMPHKEAVVPTLDHTTEAVRRLNACNCVYRDGDGNLCGDNTDGAGFVRWLEEEESVNLDGARVVVAGTGGAGRAIIDALTRTNVARISVSSRSAANVSVLQGWDGRIQMATDSDVSQADVVVNATPVGMAGGPSPDGLPFDPALHHRGQLVVDIVYNPLETEWLRLAAEAGARTANGLGMLVYQAVLAFEHWTGVPAPVDAMRAAVLANR